MKVIRNNLFNILEIGVSDKETQINNELNILGLEENNLIIDFSKTKLKINKEFFKKFLKKNFFNQRSLVIVSDKYENYENLNIVPTLIEAIDVIEIEEIERDIDRI